MKSKIAILYSGGRGIAGIEKYLVDLFANIDRTQIELELLSLGKWDLTNELVKTGNKVQIFGVRRISAKTVREIGRHCLANNIDLLVSQGVVANAYARLVAKFYHVKNLVTAHSDLISEYKKPAARKIYQLVDKVGQLATTNYIAVSEFIKKQLIKSGVSARKITVVYNGTEFAPAKRRDHKRLIIGSLGRLENVKGYDILIRAFAQIDNKRLRLKIAGDGSELENLKRLAAELDVADRVEFAGFKTDYMKFLDSIDVYVQPSRSEGFGLGLIIAMSQNLPVVVTPAGAMTEVVDDGQTGYIAKSMTSESLAVALKKAIENIAESTKIGESAGKFVRDNYSIEKWIKQTMDAYKEAVK